MFTSRTKKALIKGIITKRTPIYVQYAVTKGCNLRCKMCDSSASRKEEQELALPQIDKLANVLEGLGIGIILITGGEPFLRNDVSEIIRIFSQRGFTVRLQTNGILATEDRIESAYKAGMKEVTISLDSLISEKHDAITGQNGSWHKIIKAISDFSRILPCKDNILGVNIVVCKQNLRELPNLIRFITKIGFYASLIPIHLAYSQEDGFKKDSFIIRKYAPEFAFQPSDFDEIDYIYKEIIAMKRQGYNIYNSYKFLRNSPMFLRGKRIKWHCDSPNLYFAISPSGNFLPCVDINTSISMLADNFVHLYNSQEFKSNIKEKVKKCAGCFYACWPEMTFLCRDPLVFAERALLSIKTIFKKRKPVTYEECLRIIENIKSYKEVKF